ncbi:MAG: hypothetical protein ABSA41_01375 [Terriglobia bacterium]|jgi:hypothetical protein
MWDSIQLWGLVTQVLLFGGLVWYTVETRRIRKAAQKQAEASWEQAEAQQRPCLTVVTAARDFDEAILSTGDAEGERIVAPREGSVALENAGNGPALEVRYHFTPVSPASIIGPSGYIPGIPPRTNMTIAVALGVLSNSDYEILLTYDGLSGQRYESRIMTKNLVLTTFHFGKQRVQQA